MQPARSGAPGVFVPLSSLASQLLASVGQSNFWSDEASLILAKHPVALMRFDELRQAFEVVEGRKGAMLTPFCIVCVCGEQFHSRRVNCLVLYRTHLGAHLGTSHSLSAARWKLWETNPFVASLHLEIKHPLALLVDVKTNTLKLSKAHMCDNLSREIILTDCFKVRT